MCSTLTRRRLDFGDLQLDSVDKLQLFDRAMNVKTVRNKKVLSHLYRNY